MNSVSVTGKGLVKRYGQTEALRGLDFTVNQGEIFGFIGPDGAGKTSLFRILTTLLLPDKGSATVAGFDVVKDYRKLRQILGYMPGKFSLYQDLTVRENLEFFAGIFKADIKSNYYLIQDIYDQIAPFEKRRAGKLSGGMKQKLALSCALIHKPEVLILDEPTTGVDAVSRSEFWDMLIRLKKEGITIIVATPYMDEAVLCDRIALIQHGQILATDTPQKVIAGFRWQLFRVKTSDTLATLKILKANAEVRSAEMFGAYIHVSAPVGKLDAAKLQTIIGETRPEEVEIAEIEAGIEDCFIDLMRDIPQPIS